jgi:dolichol-phosphate mannosyltransferase
LIGDRARRLLSRLLKYGTVGGIGTCIQLASLTLLIRSGSLHYLVATVVAVETAVVHNFLWHELWTWADRGLAGAGGRMSRLLTFNFTTGLTSIAGNLFFMRLFVGELDLPPLVANIASIACCALANFLVSDRVVFLGRRSVAVD